jgi:hypothetical protein
MSTKKIETHAATSAGTSAPALPSNVTEALTLIAQVTTLLALTSQNLTAKQRKAATRSRKGMEKVIPTIANLSAEHGVSVPKQSTSAMTSNLALVTQLETVQTKLTGLLTLVSDNIDVARSGAWNTGTTLYGMLAKAAHRDSQLKSQLAPVQEYFAYRTKVAKKDHPKQPSKKAALKAEKEAAVASGSADGTESSTPAPVAAAPSASTNGAPALPSNVATAHA